MTATSAAGSARVLRATLPNGMRVVAVHSQLAPIVTTMITYLVGANDDPAEFPGLAHAQEHMMFRGSPGMSAEELAAVAASLGGSYNADAKQTVTQYFFTVPARDLDVVLQLEALRMRGVLDTEESWAKERGAIQQEVAQYVSNPEYLLSSRIQAALFAGTAYEHDSLGTADSFTRIGEEVLRRFHRTWYTPNNAILVIAGNVEPAAAIAAARKRFARIPAGPVPAKAGVTLKPVRERTIALDARKPNGTITVSFRLPGSDSGDFPAASVLAGALAASSGPLYALVAGGEALSIDFSLESFPAASIATARAEFAKGSEPAEVVSELRGVLSAVSRDGLPAEMVESAKRRHRLDAEIEKSSIWGLAVAWSRAVAIEGRQSPDDELEAIRRVMAPDVQRVAHEYLDVAHSVTGIVTSRSTPTVAAPARPRTGAAAPPRSGTPVVRLPRWVARATRPATMIASGSEPTVSVLPNGLEIIVRPHSASDAVFVLGQVRNEPSLQIPPDKEGVDEALQRLFAFGTTSLDRVAFQRALDEIGAKESAGVEFSLRVLDEDLDRGIALLADHLLRPAFAEESFRVVQRQLAATVAGRQGDAGYLSQRALRAALLPAGDPRLREPTADTVSALSAQDVRDYHAAIFRPDVTKIVVVGNVSRHRVLETIARHLGGWRAQGPTPQMLLPPVPLNQPSTTVVTDATGMQSIVTLAQSVAVTRSDPDYYALQLGNHVLVGSFGATRLNRELRTDTGLVYGVSSTIDVHGTSAVYSVRFACDPSNVEAAREIVVRNLESMRSTAVSPEELARARDIVLHEIALSNSSEEAVARGLLRRATDGLPLDEPRSAARLYTSLGAEAVRAAFARLLRPERFVVVTRRPDTARQDQSAAIGAD
jgi:zinc protease